MNKVFKMIINVIYIFIIAVLLCYFVFRTTNKVRIYNVKTGSMEDKIHAGDYILIYKMDNYNVGDVITFEVDDGFVTHRIIKINGDMLVTKGDANNTEDDEIRKDDIIGKVILSGGILNIIINNKYALVGFLLSFYLISCYIENNNKKDDSDNKEVNEKNK